MAYLYRIDDLKAPPGYDGAWVRAACLRILALPDAALLDVTVAKESIDARKKPQVLLVLQVEVRCQAALPELPPGVSLQSKSTLEIEGPPGLKRRGLAAHDPVVVVGAGPAGYFAALALAEAGVRTVLLERGKAVEPRMRDIGQLRSFGTLDPESNVCFGEGGAGAYTDGKLYTRIKDPLARWVLKRFVDFQAPADILVSAHPHLGTDKLVRIVKRMREHLESLGVEVRFGAKVARLRQAGGAVTGLVLADGTELAARRVVLAIGHSARDTLEALVADGVHLEPKAFAVGVRVEHPQELIDRSQYGDPGLKTALGAAAYALTHQVADREIGNRGVYSFCMCPGGFIVPSPTEPEHMAINGMSNANRSTAFANSGVVVQVLPEDLRRLGYAEGPLMCIGFQRALEAQTFGATRLPYAAPAMRIADFVAGKARGTLAPTHFRPAAEAADLRTVLPKWLIGPLVEAFEGFNRKLKGFTSEEANMLAIESRTSSPIRITRGANLQSVSTAGLYPVGEGAGYAGGIVSAAVDGIRAAEAIIQELHGTWTQG